MKKKKVFIGILILLLLFGMYLKRERYLGEVLDISREDIRKCSVEEIYAAEDAWKYKTVEIVDWEIIGNILNQLDETRVSFKKWAWTSDLEKGEYCYDLLIFDNSKYWIRFMENGEIQILNMGHWVFEANAEDTKECIDILENLIQEYEVKS